MARRVPIAAKLHVRLEELAARRLPGLKITASGFGRDDTGQIAQLPLYDLFARRFHPRLVVLVFVINDFRNNSPILTAVWKGKGWEPDRPSPRAKATPPGPDGAMRILPPSPRTPGAATRARAPLMLSLYSRARALGLPRPWFAGWLRTKWNHHAGFPVSSALRVRAEALAAAPAHASLFEDGWRPTPGRSIDGQFMEERLPRVFEDALAYTGFALDQFRERVERDGAALAVLASHTVGGRANPAFERLRALTETRRIPLISQHDYIVRQGGRVSGARFRYNQHWNAQGHQWAAEALSEYLARHPEACARHRRTGESRREDTSALPAERAGAPPGTRFPGGLERGAIRRGWNDGRGGR